MTYPEDPLESRRVSASGLGFSPWQTVAPMAGVLGYHGITFRILPIVPFPPFVMSTLTYIPDPALPDLLQGVHQRASALNRSVVLCEADDPRVLRAGVQAQQRGVARITLVGNRKAIEQCAAAEGLSLDGLTIRDPANDSETEALADRLFQHRQHKGMTPEKAAAEISKPLVFANMLVAEGKVDGSVAGATTPTARPGSWPARIWPATRSSWCAGTTTPCCSRSAWPHAMSTGSAQPPSQAAPTA